MNKIKLAELVAGMVKRVDELHMLGKLIRNDIEDHIQEIKDDLAKMHDDMLNVFDTLSMDVPKMAWCKTHKEYEPGVPYHKEPDYMPEDDAKGRKEQPAPSVSENTLPLLNSMLRWFEPKCRGNCETCKK